VQTKFVGATETGAGSLYNEKANGYQLGVGYETALTHALGLVFEYDYTGYDKFNGPVTTAGTSTSYKIRDNLITAGVNLHF
jgi:opacity protein-like surface antigen